MRGPKSRSLDGIGRIELFCREIGLRGVSIRVQRDWRDVMRCDAMGFSVGWFLARRIGI